MLPDWWSHLPHWFLAMPSMERIAMGMTPRSRAAVPQPVARRISPPKCIVSSCSLHPTAASGVVGPNRAAGDVNIKPDLGDIGRWINASLPGRITATLQQIIGSGPPSTAIVGDLADQIS